MHYHQTIAQDTTPDFSNYNYPMQGSSVKTCGKLQFSGAISEQLE